MQHVGVLHVTGKRALSNVEVRIRLSRTRLNSRGELGGVAAGRTSGKDGDIVARQVADGLPGAERPASTWP